MIITLISAVALLTILSNLVWVPLIPCAIMCVYTLAYRPYKNLGDNIRSSFNLIVMSAFYWNNNINFSMYSLSVKILVYDDISYCWLYSIVCCNTNWA